MARQKSTRYSEYDEAQNLVSVYIQSGDKSSSRIDVDVGLQPLVTLNYSWYVVDTSNLEQLCQIFAECISPCRVSAFGNRWLPGVSMVSCNRNPVNLRFIGIRSMYYHPTQLRRCHVLMCRLRILYKLFQAQLPAYSLQERCSKVFHLGTLSILMYLRRKWLMMTRYRRRRFTRLTDRSFASLCSPR